MESILGLVLNVVLAIYLVIEARKYGKSPVLWGILGFVFGAIALGIFLIRTNRKLVGWIITIISLLGYIIFILLIGLAAVMIGTV